MRAGHRMARVEILVSYAEDAYKEVNKDEGL
ncbi:hypothetical protein BSP21_127 [Bacillus phage BSP21]|nr:hypothetical protein BSP21_127 [Bacillus phage BSP21]